MAKTDSLDKVITSYFASVTNEPFTYKGTLYEPVALRVSPLLFRGFTCPANCAACCPRFSLDFLPNETHPYDLQKRTIDFNDGIEVYSDMQSDHDNHHCRNVNRDNGRCMIHGKHPFSCDFELIRFMTRQQQDTNEQKGFVPRQNTTNSLTQRLYGRGWNMKRIDDSRGAKCEMTEPDEETKAEVVRKLTRLGDWLQHFGIKEHKVNAILRWAKRPGLRSEPLYLLPKL